jgi:hypothetical protein
VSLTTGGDEAKCFGVRIRIIDFLFETQEGIIRGASDIRGVKSQKTNKEETQSVLRKAVSIFPTLAAP